jgi:hypothetical protein
MKIILTFICFFLIQLCVGQEKFEKEQRINESAVPQSALSFVNSLNPPKKVKWYLEISNSGKHIEAKTKISKSLYSIKFGMDGELVDLEIELKPEILNDSLLVNLNEQLFVHFKKFRIERIQIQYLGTPDAVRSAAKALEKISSSEMTVKYEIIVKGKKEKRFELFEVTTDQNGFVLQQLLIVLPKTDNLEF